MDVVSLVTLKDVSSVLPLLLVALDGESFKRLKVLPEAFLIDKVESML